MARAKRKPKIAGKPKANIDDIYLRIGSNIRALRNKLGLTIEELANSADMNPSFVGHIERGHSKPTLYSVQKLAKTLNVPLTQLFGLEVVKNPASDEDKINLSVMRILNSKSLSERVRILKVIKHL